MMLSPVFGSSVSAYWWPIGLPTLSLKNQDDRLSTSLTAPGWLKSQVAHASLLASYTWDDLTRNYGNGESVLRVIRLLWCSGSGWPIYVSLQYPSATQEWPYFRSLSVFLSCFGASWGVSVKLGPVVMLTANDSRVLLVTFLHRRKRQWTRWSLVVGTTTG